MLMVYGSNQTKCPDLMLAHCSASSNWVPGGNTGETKVGRKGTGHPTSHAYKSIQETDECTVY